MFDKELVAELYQESGILKPVYVGILNHIMGVTHVAEYLALLLNQKGVGVDLELVSNGAILHDIGKAFDEGDQEHIIQGVNFLTQAGVDRNIIDIVERHQVWSFGEGRIPEPSTLEQKIVFLADLIFGGSIMPFPTRVDDLIQRHSDRMPRGPRWLKSASDQLYAEISAILSPYPFPF